jgi:predicted transposase/invertase (TIGR01784 family)
MRKAKGGEKPILKLKNDYVFRHVFTRPEAKGALKDLLLSILDLPESEFGHIEISDPNLYREREDGKAGELDLRIQTATGKIIHVEIQLNPGDAFRDGLVYYASRMIAEQLSAGDSYGKYCRVVSIAITDFVMIDENNKYHNSFRLYDKDTQELFSDALEIDTLELPKVGEESDGTKLWDWMKLIMAESEEEMEALAKKNDHIEECVMVIRKMSQDEAQRRLAEAEEKQERDRRAQVLWGRKEGLREGHEKGREEGLAEGIAKERAAIARRLTELGKTDAEVAEILGDSERA